MHTLEQPLKDYNLDVGAARLKPLFIGGSVVTVVLLDLAMIAERWLRHEGKLAQNTSWVQKGLSIIAIIAAIAGALGLILLSIFDTLRHHTLHDDVLILFMWVTTGLSHHTLPGLANSLNLVV